MTRNEAQKKIGDYGSLTHLATLTDPITWAVVAMWIAEAAVKAVAGAVFSSIIGKLRDERIILEQLIRIVME